MTAVSTESDSIQQKEEQGLMNLECSGEVVMVPCDIGALIRSRRKKYSCIQELTDSPTRLDYVHVGLPK